MKREDATLFSGAAPGTEAAFGAAAERWGITEVNFSFEGHKVARERGLRVLTAAELRRGDVSIAYAGRLMHRRYPDTPLFRKVLQTIWHQVTSVGDVFVVGRVNPDDTVTGGTGVGAELAKLFNKRLHVFDQERGAWLRWAGESWETAGDPRVEHPDFAGTGTRFLRDAGRAAIEALFARSFA